MNFLISGATLVNEMKQLLADVYIKDGVIHSILLPGDDRSFLQNEHFEEIKAKGKYLLPGIIDDQVHFREPGLTHKGEIYTEAKAAVAGGITSFMEMPNTVPSATTIELLEHKYHRASECSLANYSFYMGTTNTNLEELLKVDPSRICGVKIFMGSSTGDMLVDDPNTLEAIFKEVKTLIATHCEDDPMIKRNAAAYREKYGEKVPMKCHAEIRNAEACFASSSFAVQLAEKYNTRLHILHISTARELELFRNDIPLKEKRITAEACIHHLWFSDADYETKGSLIKWNPAVKTAADRDAVFQAVLDDRIDVIATDHAPHTLEEKSQTYFKAPSGGPLVQHSLNAMLEFYHQGKISLEKIVQKMCHNVADMFAIRERGYIRTGYKADLVLVDLNKSYTVDKSNILYKCGWSPFEGTTFHSVVTHTWVNGHLAYHDGVFDESKKGERLLFDPH
jgi:dihydroorotase